MALDSPCLPGGLVPCASLPCTNLYTAWSGKAPSIRQPSPLPVYDNDTATGVWDGPYGPDDSQLGAGAARQSRSGFGWGVITFICLVR